MGRKLTPPLKPQPLAPQPTDEPATMIHRYSQARQAVRVTKGNPGWFWVNWPLCIAERIRATGYGTGRLRNWRLDLQDLRRLRAEPAYEPPGWPERKAKSRKVAVPKVDHRQLALFARAA